MHGKPVQNPHLWGHPKIESNVPCIKSIPSPNIIKLHPPFKKSFFFQKQKRNTARLIEQGVAIMGRNTSGPPCSRGAIIRMEVA